MSLGHLRGRGDWLRVRNVLDDWLPPRIRDSKVVMYPLLRVVFGRRFRMFAGFKQRGFVRLVEGSVEDLPVSGRCVRHRGQHAHAGTCPADRGRAVRAAYVARAVPGSSLVDLGDWLHVETFDESRR